ncbi:hypothetical protein C5C13_04310 [Clavibacter michiganensis]|nr:hypothetical protein C5C13_04310 [Clavibacter michiganensis]
MVVALSFEAVVQINLEFGGRGAGVRDANGVHAAVGRAFNGFAGVDPFPSVFDKAAALMHGLATTQYFHDGNKRTAFLSAVSFLELNGFDLGLIEPVSGEVFTLAVAADLVVIDKIAEWFRDAHERRRRGAAVDPRFEYLMLASDTTHDGYTGNWFNVGVASMLLDPGAAKPPYEVPIVVCARVHWREEDVGHGHVVSVAVVPRDQATTRVPRRNKARLELSPPGRGGHGHHPDGLMPTIFTTRVAPQIVDAGSYVVEVRLDGAFIGELPLEIGMGAFAV